MSEEIKLILSKLEILNSELLATQYVIKASKDLIEQHTRHLENIEKYLETISEQSINSDDDDY